MLNNGWVFLDLDGGSPYVFPVDPLAQHSLGGNLLSQIGSFVDSSLYHSRFLYVPGSRAIQEAFSSMSKFAGALLFLFAGGSDSTMRHNLHGNSHGSNPSNNKSSMQVRRIVSTRQNLSGVLFNPVFLGNIPGFIVRQLFREAEQLHSFPFLSLAAALVPPLGNVSHNVLAVPLENSDTQMQRGMDQSPCQVEHGGCSDISFLDLNWTRHAVEPRTGIAFPTIIDNIFARESNSSLMSEVNFKTFKLLVYGFFLVLITVVSITLYSYTLICMIMFVQLLLRCIPYLFDGFSAISIVLHVFPLTLILSTLSWKL